MIISVLIEFLKRKFSYTRNPAHSSAFLILKILLRFYAENPTWVVYNSGSLVSLLISKFLFLITSSNVYNFNQHFSVSLYHTHTIPNAKDFEYQIQFWYVYGYLLGLWIEAKKTFQLKPTKLVFMQPENILR